MPGVRSILGGGGFRIPSEELKLPFSLKFAYVSTSFRIPSEELKLVAGIGSILTYCVLEYLVRN